MIENQDDLRSSLDKNRELKEQIKTLEASLSKPEVPQSESDSQLDELQTKVRIVFHPFNASRLSFTLDRGNIRFDF